jgi:recombination protein RecT
MNAPMTQNQTAVAGRNTFSAFMAGDGVKRKIGEIIAGKKGDGFITSIVACVSNNPALGNCDNGTILSAGLQGAALDLSPSPALGHFYMVPFEDRKNGRTVATFQIGYKGYIQLAIRSGQYRRINVIAIKDGELVSWNPLTEDLYTKLIDDDSVREGTSTTGYYAMFELVNGFIKTMYWSKAKMEAHAQKYSKGYAAKKGYTFWEKDFDGMAFKTMLRQLLSKWGVMSIELQRAFESDMSVLNSDGRPDYIDNQAEDVIEGNGAQEQKSAPAAYPQEQFDKNIAGWHKLIATGKKTADQVIAMANSKAPLTDEQIKAIKNTSAQSAEGSAQAGNGGAGAAAQNPEPTGEMTQAEIDAARARELKEAGQ